MAKKKQEDPGDVTKKNQPDANLNENGSVDESKNDSTTENDGLGDSDPEFEPDTNEKVTPKPKLSVVIPYFAEKAQGVELLMALRSIEKNFKEDFKIVIVGDKPEWLSDEAIFIDVPNISRNAGIDTLNKIKHAIADARVSDQFIMTYDDIYFVSPVMLADIQFLVAYGNLNRPESPETFFHKNKNRTIDVLEAHGLKTLNYDTHTPYFFEKEKLVELLEVFDEFNSEDQSLLLSSIYYNYHFPEYSPLMIDNVRGNYLLRLISEKPDPKVFEKYISGKKFLNNTIKGYNNLLIDYLNKNFPEKSRFEV